MRKLTLGYKGIFAIYIFLVLFLGSYLLLNNQFLLNNNTPQKLPLDFLLRFGIFWFVSFVLALLFFVVHIRMNEYTLSASEISQSAKVGMFIFAGGVSAAALSMVVWYSLG